MLTCTTVTAILAFTGAVTAKPIREGKLNQSLPTAIAQPERLPQAYANIQNNAAGAAFTLKSDLVARNPKHQLEHIVDVKRSFGVDVHPELAEAAKQAATKRNAHLAARKVTGTVFGKSPDPWDTEFIYPVQVAGRTLHLFMTTSTSIL